jgi:hypothetical protein
MKKKSTLLLLAVLIALAFVTSSVCIAQPIGLLPPPGFQSETWGLQPGTEYTPWQEAAMEGLKIGFRMGQMYNMAQQGYNINSFNAEVDNYNAWVRQNFGSDPNLIMQKMQEGMPGYVPQTTPVIVFRDPLGWV